MFEYDSKDAETAWPEGQYPGIFKGAVDGVSKSSGQAMQTWIFEVFDDQNDRKQEIKEYVTKASLFKVRQLAAALNKAQAFKDNQFFPEDHADSPVMLDLKIEKSDGYDDKNRINKILARPVGTPPITTAEKMLAPPSLRPRARTADAPLQTVPEDSQPPIKDDDIPF